MSSATLAGCNLVGFDLETTGTDPFTARIVTASLCSTDTVDRNWLANPGVEIPVAATAVHGISTDHVRAHGRDAAEVVGELSSAIADIWRDGGVLVIYNAAYDLRVLTQEIQRHDLPPLELGPILDPLVLWRKAERYRKGKKTLTDAVTRFDIPLGVAHDAAADATAAVQVAVALADLVPWRSWTPVEALATQQEWNREWADSFAAWLRERGGDWESVDGSWPLGDRR